MTLSPECQKPSNSTLIAKESKSGQFVIDQPEYVVHDADERIVRLR